MHVEFIARRTGSAKPAVDYLLGERLPRMIGHFPARAFQSMVGGGMDVAKAAGLAGLMESE